MTVRRFHRVLGSVVAGLALLTLALVLVADLRRPGFSDSAPASSPDGRWIAVVGRDDEGASGIWLLDPNGGGGRPVQVSPGEQYTPPARAAGGVSKAFSRLANGRHGGAPSRSGAPTEWELWVADGDGGNARRLPVDGLAEGWVP